MSGLVVDLVIGAPTKIHVYVCLPFSVMHRLNVEMKSARHVVKTDWKVGDNCCMFFQEHWYRARIDQIMKDHCQVR